ncbi:MAG: phosphodiesterase [Ilumatobacteraceae bacterium]|nr:phosphodiesterase [Ilumatobacteraceae bacterium]
MLVAHLSDPHIFARGELMEGVVDTAANLSLALASLKELAPTPEFVVLTGDLVNDGQPNQYDHLKKVLGSSLDSFIVVAGNHDDRAGLRALFPQLSAVGSGDDPIDYVIDAERDGRSLSLIVLDTTVPGEHAGALDATQLEWLDRQLAERRDREILIVQHHPPFRSGIGFMDAYGLRGAEAEAAIVAKYANVAAVISGHLHRPATAAWGGTVAFASPSTAAQVSPSFNGETTSYTDEPGMMSLHWWTKTGVASHVQPIGDSGRWVPAWAK